MLGRPIGPDYSGAALAKVQNLCGGDQLATCVGLGDHRCGCDNGAPVDAAPAQGSSRVAAAPYQGIAAACACGRAARSDAGARRCHRAEVEDLDLLPELQVLRSDY